MIGASRLLATLTKLVKQTRADGVSVCAQASTRRVFRFAHEAIHQDLAQESVNVTVKAIAGRRTGVAGADTLEPESLRRCVRSALEIAKHSPPSSDLPPLPRGHRICSTADYVAATARASPASCVAELKRLFQMCRGVDAQLAGSMIVGEDELAVVNSSATACYASSTIAGAKLVTMYRKLSGFASGVHPDIAQLNLDGLLKRSLGQSLHRLEPITLPVGTYEVILEPEAVAELMEWLGSIAFGAKSVEKRTSFLAGQMGEQLMDRQVTILDHGNQLGSLRLPFDFEGTPKQKVILIDRGKAAGIVYDSLYGQRFGRASTGHAMSPDDVEGPMPLHLAMAPGRAAASQMVHTCRRGLLIPRFHYVNGLLNPRTALMTGLTREGTFLIEDGKLVAPVATMRFTQSVTEAFSRVAAISKERRLVADPSTGLGCALMPSVHLKRFQFTGRSES